MHPMLRSSRTQALCACGLLLTSFLVGANAGTFLANRLQEGGLAHWDRIHRSFNAPVSTSVLADRRSLAASKKTTTNKEPAPTMCKFQEATDTLLSACYPNDAYMLTLAKTSVAKKGSPFAIEAVMGAVGKAECNKHNASTPKGQDECYNDKKNDCFLQADILNMEMSCQSRLGWWKSACKGTLYQEVLDCGTYNKKECQAAKTCAWSPISVYGEVGTVAIAAEAYSNLTGGKYEQEQGLCVHREYAAHGTANFTEDQTFDFNSVQEWFFSTYESADPNTFFKYRGTCEYAKKALARIQYNTYCDVYNIYQVSDTMPYGTIAIRDDKPANVTNIMGCINSNCRLFQRDTAAVNLALLNISYGFIECAASNEMFNSMRYDPKTDGPVYTAYTRCYSEAAQHDKNICLGIK